MPDTARPTPAKIKRALISVSNKAGLVEFAVNLADRGIEILSTGGTAKALEAAGIKVVDVGAYTGFPEMMGGRLKTLHPKVHGGLLQVRGDQTHEAAATAHDIPKIDLLVVNLYPFEQTVANGGSFEECIENIDIGGPAMIRAAAKNHVAVTVVVDIRDYDVVTAELDQYAGAVSADLRRNLAAKAYARTALYDTAISNWFAGQLDATPDYRTVGGRLAQTLRYGENPHQTAAFYRTGENRPGVATAHQLQGKELSYNNLNDTDAAFELISEFDPEHGPAVAIIKHANPCGVARGRTPLEAYRAALRCDPVSAFGGIIALNMPIDDEAAEEITKIFTEVVVAPAVTDGARGLFEAKPNLRLLVTADLADPRAPGLLVKSVAGGLLFQSRDSAVVDDLELRVVTERAPSEQELADLKFAFTVAKHVKSNAIVYARAGATVGIGAGQMSRLDSSRIAARKAEDAAAGLDRSLAENSVVASDAFFPFADGLLAAAEAGATAIIQPGGSVRDDEVIAAADKMGLAMVFTGVRHFRH
jgi:phosphoribosylaminoimidazolecarboxamide formyltransferase/IMP cyclohydrolase